MRAFLVAGSLLSLSLFAPSVAAETVEGALVSVDGTATGLVLRVDQAAFSTVVVEFEWEWIGSGHGDATYYIWACGAGPGCVGSPWFTSQPFGSGNGGFTFTATSSFAISWVFGLVQVGDDHWPIPASPLDDPRPFPVQWVGKVTNGDASAVPATIYGDFLVSV